MSRNQIDTERTSAPSGACPSDRSPTEKLTAQCRRIVDDLFVPDGRIYWADFLITLCLSYATAILYMRTPWGSGIGMTAFAVSSVLLYRLAMFLHEIVHFRQGQLPGFSLTWNLLAGIPLLMPTFLYQSHLTHHNSRHYGTDRDGEYLPLARGTVGNLLTFLSQVFYQPLFVFFRFLVGTPLSFLSPALRRWIHERASSLVINFQYRREVRELHWRSIDFWIEIGCCLRAWALIVYLACGFAPWTRLPKLYLLACCALGMNHVRTMVAHRYRNDGEELSHDDQFLDSTNVTGGWLTELWGPLGLRYHALHHLLPGIPYHNLGIAHRRLAAALPADSLYHRATCACLAEVVVDLWSSVAGRGGLEPDANLASQASNGASLSGSSRQRAYP